MKGLNLTQFTRKATGLIFSILMSFTFYATIVPQTNSIISVYQTSVVDINDPLTNSSLTEISPRTGNFVDNQVVNKVSFFVNYNYQEYLPDAHVVWVKLLLEREDAIGPIADTIIELEINYDPLHGATFNDQQIVNFQGAYKIKTTLLAIKVDGNDETILPANLEIKTDILVDRIDNIIQPVMGGIVSVHLMESIVGSGPLDTDCDGKVDVFRVGWEYATGQVEYQLEWAFINDFGNVATSPLPPNLLDFNFKFNSTRITTSLNHFDISLIYDQGWLIYRLRGVGVQASDPNKPVFTNWIGQEFGHVSDLPNTNKYQILPGDGHMPSMNWQYSATYAEEGKKKEVISYFDGTLRNRQSVTKINSSENVVVGETIYDHQGRPVVQVLPVPVTDPTCSTGENIPSIKYYPNFNQNNSNTPYNRENFDLDNGSNCASSTEPMNSSSGAAKYYSTNNLDNDEHQGFVPESNGFPFTTVEYTNDNTGRITKQSGVGPDFNLGSGHETKYLYGQPDQLELDRLFGSEVGNTSHYKKNVVIDGNGQSSISYLDQEGRVIATALAGASPTNLSSLTSASGAGAQLTLDAFNKDINGVSTTNTLTIAENGYEFNTQLVVAYNSNFEFDYNFVIAPLEDECLPNICVDCVYDLKLKLTDECGSPLIDVDNMVGKFSLVAGNYVFHASCTSNENYNFPGIGNSFPAPLTSPLTPGMYNLTKILTINEEAMYAYVDTFFAQSTCALTYNDFLQQAMDEIDTTDCNVTCESCFENLGTLEDFIAAGNGTSTDYNNQYEVCNDLCNGGDKTFCEIALDILMMDMSPQGQYAQHTDNNTNVFNPDAFPLSILSMNNSLPKPSADWRHPEITDQYGIHYEYQDENGQPARIHVTENGGTYLPQIMFTALLTMDPSDGELYTIPQNLTNVEDFVTNFQMSWAKSLVVYHPEYCYYEECLTYTKEVHPNDEFTSMSFDDLLRVSETFQDAKDNKLIKSDNTMHNWFQQPSVPGDWAWDPYVVFSSNYENTECSGMISSMSFNFNNYVEIGGVMRSIPELASYMARCGNTLGSTPAPGCFDFDNISGIPTVILDQQWSQLKMYYLSMKQGIQRQMEDCKAKYSCNAYNGCIGEENYNPMAAGMINLPAYGNNTVMGIIFNMINYYNSPNFNPLQPCNSTTAAFYVNKIKRFSTPSTDLDETAQSTSYQVYLATGQCPLAFATEQLINKLISEGTLEGTGVLLNNYQELQAFYNADNNYFFPGALPQLTYNSTSTPTQITATWDDPSPYTQVHFILNKSASIPWSDIISIGQLSATGNTFTATAFYYDIDDTLRTFPITGELTEFNLSYCNFPPVCTEAPIAANLDVLFNTILLEDKIESTSLVGINPLVLTSGSMPNLVTTAIANAAFVGTNLGWKYDASLPGFSIENLSTPGDGLKLKILSTEPSTFNLNDLDQINFFDPIESGPQGTFSIIGHLAGNILVKFNCDATRLINGESYMVKIGNCELPTPLSCVGDVYENTDYVSNLLFDVIVNRPFEGNNIDIFTSTELHPGLIDFLPLGTTNSTSNYTAYSTSNSIAEELNIIMPNCSINIFRNGPNTQAIYLDDIVEFISVEVDKNGVQDIQSNYNDLKIYAKFVSGGNIYFDTLFVSTCIPMRMCKTCPDTQNTSSSMATFEQLTQSRIQAGLVERIPYSNYSSQSFSSMMYSAPTNYCRESYDLYINCIANYNIWAQANNAPIINTVYSDQDFYAYNFCDCAQKYCDILSGIVNGEVNPYSVDFYVYTDIYYLCDPANFCRIKYDQYLSCINNFNAWANNNDPTFVITDIVDYTEFESSLNCSCVDNLCYNLSLIINGFVDPYSVDFAHYSNIREACVFVTEPPTPCELAYKEYLYCLDNFNYWALANDSNLILTNVLDQNSFINQDLCECTTELCDRLNLIVTGQIDPYSINFETYTDILIFCDSINEPPNPCDSAYQMYTGCITGYNIWASSYAPNYVLTSVLSNSQFDSLGLCGCVLELCDRLNLISTGQINLASINFNAYTDITIICDTVNEPPSCDSAYLMYTNCIANYNNWANVNATNMIFTNILTQVQFESAGVCDCAQELCDRFGNIIGGTIVVTPANFYQYTDIVSFCDSIPPEDWCEYQYENYISCTNEYNIWASANLNSNWIYTDFVTLTAFEELNLCYCIDELCARLNAIRNGTANILEQEFPIYTSLIDLCDAISTPPCVPEIDSLLNIEMPMVEFDNDCIEMALNQAIIAAQLNYANYQDSMTNVLIEKYKTHCLKVDENLTYTYDNLLYHFTLYYYDQAGNLIKTIPPEGVKVLPTTSSTDPISMAINADRTNHTKTTFTNHQLATRYEYNSLNQLVTQSTPDADPMDIFEMTLPNGLHAKLVTTEIQMLNSSKGYLSGSVDGRGYFYTTNNGGDSWTKIQNTLGADLTKVHFFDSDFGIAIGSEGTIIQTLDGGSTWDLVPVILGSGITDFVKWNDMAFETYNAGSQMSSGFLVGEEGQVYKCDVNNFNFNFNQATSGITGIAANNSVKSITLDGTEYNIIVNDLSTLPHSTKIYSCPFGGANWTEMELMTTQKLTDIAYYNSTGAYASGLDGRLYKNSVIPLTSSITDANKWYLVPTSLVDEISSIEFFNEQSGLALVKLNGATDLSLMRTDDSGLTWNVVSTETYNHLSISNDKTRILAVGNNSVIAMAHNTPGSEISPITFLNSTSNLTAGWISKTNVSSYGIYEYAVVVGTSTSSFYSSPNIDMNQPTWITSAASGVTAGQPITAIAAKVLATNKVIGMVKTANNKAYGFSMNDLNSNVNVVSTSLVAMDIVGDLAVDYQSEQVFVSIKNGSTRKYAVASIAGPNAPSTMNLSAAIPLSDPNANLDKISVTNMYGVPVLVGISNYGDLNVCKFNASGSTISFQKDLRLLVRPVQMESVDYLPILDKKVALGKDGQCFIYDANLMVWKQVGTQTNSTLYDACYGNNLAYFAGDKGYFAKSNLMTNTSGNITATPLILQSGVSVANTFTNESFKAITMEGNRMYVVGSNGAMLFNSDLTTNFFTSGTHGNKTLNSVVFRPGTINAISVGDQSEIHSMFGGGHLKIKDIYLPPGVDIHFQDVNNGTLLSDNFTIRTTSDGGATWNIVLPALGYATTGLTNVHTFSSNVRFAFGSATQFGIENNIASPIIVAGITSIQTSERQGNVLYVAGGSSVKKMIINTTSPLTFSVLSGASITGANIKALHIFDNGDYAVAGQSSSNGFFSYHIAGTNVQVFSETFVGKPIYDMVFFDRITGVLVGTNGTYLRTKTQQISTSGYLAGTQWEQKLGVYNPSVDPYAVSASNQIDILAISAISPTHVLIGGNYKTPFANYSNPAYCYVRKIMDAGGRYSSRFYYDALGRLVVSQNARQYNEMPRKFSYTRYDNLGRVFEVGEKTENSLNTQQFKIIFGTDVSGTFNPSVIDENKLSIWLTSVNGERREVTQSYYDQTSLTSLPSGFAPAEGTQRKRIVHVTYEELYDGDDQTYDHATHYDYDIHGNVKTLIQDNQKMAEDFPSLATTERFKRMDYQFDLVSGNVNRMSVQTGESDQWHHAYEYDADNRITDVYTNKNQPLIISSPFIAVLQAELAPLTNIDWEKEASYTYYNHGPLARVEIGNDQLQGLDYIYTLQGWLKGVNSVFEDRTLDPGEDNVFGTLKPHQTFAKDAMAFSLSYFNNDYAPIKTTNAGWNPQVNSSSHAANNSSQLFNGNIRYMQTRIHNPNDYTAMPMLNAYQYDQLQRLINSRSYENGLSTEWNPVSYQDQYYNHFEYDQMGNIRYQIRHNRAGTLIDNLTYNYHKNANNDLVRNRLYLIDDLASASAASDDLEDQGAFIPHSSTQDVNLLNNYRYDAEGRLVHDVSENIDEIIWRVDGKIKEIVQSDPGGSKNTKFDYDAMGQRIAKHVYDSQSGVLEKSTYYTLDAQGNTLNTYEHVVDNTANTTAYQLAERQIYGSSRLGIFTEKVDRYTPVLPADNTTSYFAGKKHYELSNHLGNVLAVISDIKMPVDDNTDGTVDGYLAKLVNSTDYSPFGVQLDGRTFSSEEYRYGFQGQESDDEIKGEGNSVNYKYRMHDPRVGRFFAVDPLAPKYPHNSPYAFSENIVIHGKELEGLEVYFFMLDFTDNTRSQLQLVLHDVIDAKINTMFGPVDMNQGEVNLIKGTDGEWHELPFQYANQSLSVFGNADEIFEAVNSFPVKPNAQMGLNYKNNVEALAPLFDAMAIVLSGVAFQRLPAVRVTANKTPKTYLNSALKRQGLKNAPKRMKETWKDGDYKYSVRLKHAKGEYGRKGTELRVSRQKKGSGTEYLDKEGNWHHESTLKPGRKGNTNPKFNEKAAKDTHIQL